MVRCLLVIFGLICNLDANIISSLHAEDYLISKIFIDFVKK